ncbi:MAG: hypothetical protein HZC36_01630 [Armatimonadetes bacterium]|nr:hypothetical protein [Armatimonadota bacterium]
MNLRKLFYRWQFGDGAEAAEEYDRRIDALTWIRQDDPETLKRIDWINGLPLGIRLEVAELYQRSFDMQQTLIAERERVVQLISKKNMVEFEHSSLVRHITELEAGAEPTMSGGPALSEARSRQMALGPLLAELEETVAAEKARIIQLETETRQAAELALSSWPALLKPKSPEE